MPRKLPKSYLVKLKEEQVRVSVAKKNSEVRQQRQAEQGLSSVTMLRSFEGNCTACGQRTLFAVDGLGYCKCSKCGSQANFRLGVA
jgi:tRNA(Ile2) C34 agmatinyltransferase TiaS